MAPSQVVYSYKTQKMKAMKYEQEKLCEYIFVWIYDYNLLYSSSTKISSYNNNFI